MHEKPVIQKEEGQFQTMRNMTGAGIKAGVTVAVALALVWPAAAQELSENSVRSFMDYAWSLTPARFTKPSGEVIQIDKKNKDSVLVPVDVAREVIKVGRLSAHAQVCDLKDEQITNYRSLMYREEDKKKWSQQQLIYISQLHLTTVMMLTGKLKLVEKQGDKEVVVEEIPSKGAQTCTDEQRSKVKDLILAYVKTGPAFATAPVAGDAKPDATGSVPAAQPTAAPAASAPPAAKK